MKEKLKKILFGKPSNIYILIANVAINITWVFLLGLFISKSITNTLIIIGVWTLSLKLGKAKHYSSPLKCFLMQVMFFASLFISTYINIYIAGLFTLYAKFLLSGWADIEIEENEASWQDMTLWKPQSESSVHQPLIDYLKLNMLSDEYLEAEKLLKERVDTKTFLIYKRRFIDGYSYEKIAEEFDMPSPRIKECLDKCYFFLIGRLKI